MPVLDTERRGSARSALRYRPIDTNQAAPGPAISLARRSRANARVTTAPAEPDDLDLEEQAPGRRAVAPARQRPAPPAARTRWRMPPLLYVGLGLIVTILLWIGISQAVIWGTNEYNNIAYGYPRTYQVDAVVGHGDSVLHPSHFLALNLRGTVSIIEFPTSDPDRARVLATTNVLGPNADQAMVTLAFIDVNHNRKPDMLIDIDGVESVLINDQGTFRPPTPTEQQQILSAIQQQH